ncbi:MAG TPA: hypothetical protein VGW58_04810 [Pyrinomonadaceae bacterium]|nr:hypothetical protein [Pyrinomonadaceae bacterium]
MNLKRRKASRAIAALLLFSVLQVSLQISFAEPNSTNTAPVVQQQIVARLTTRNNQSITVNGQSAGNGASVLTGATTETGADQFATLNVGPLGSVDIYPNTKVVVTFEQGSLKATVFNGCVKLTAKKNTTGEIATEQASLGKTDPATGGVLEMCNRPGAPPAVGPGVAGAGPGAPAATAGTAGGLFGLGWPATIAIITASTAAGLTPLFFPDDTNPSRSTP